MVQQTQQQATGRRGVIFGLIAAPIAWAVMHMFDYIWIESACRAGVLSEPVLGVPGVAWVIIAATVAALAVSVAAVIISYRRHRATRSPFDVDDLDPVEARNHFLGRLGLLVSALFTLLIIMTGLPVLFFSPCLASP